MARASVIVLTLAAGLNYVHAKAPTTSWLVHQGRHCGGESILAWSNGENSRYGSGYVSDLDGCMETCRAHSECAGFVYRAEDDKCSFWKSGPLTPHTLAGHTCYERKQEAPTTSWLVHQGQHCGGTSILVWSNGKSSSYGSGYVDDLDGCKEACRAHTECAGFVYRASDNRCSFWKLGPLAPHKRAGHTCYEKKEEAPTTSWFVHQGQHCGGKSIFAWSNGQSSNYGSGYVGDLDGCKQTCCAHFECAGFVYRAMDDICSFWKSGPLELQTFPGHTCYEKTVEANLHSGLQFAIRALGSASNSLSDPISGMALGAKPIISHAGHVCWDLDNDYLEYLSGYKPAFGQTYTHAVWVYWRYNDSGWRTLIRGSDDHSVLTLAGAKDLGMYSNRDGGFRNSGYDITFDMSSWQLVIVVGQGDSAIGSRGKSTFYTAAEGDTEMVRRGSADRVVSGTNFYRVGWPAQGPGKVAAAYGWSRALSETEMNSLLTNGVTGSLQALANFGPYATPPPRRLQLPTTAAPTDDTNQPAEPTAAPALTPTAKANTHSHGHSLNLV